MDAVQKELQKQREIHAKEVAEGFPNKAKRREETTLREKLRKAQEKIEALEEDKFELAVFAFFRFQAFGKSGESRVAEVGQGGRRLSSLSRLLDVF